MSHANNEWSMEQHRQRFGGAVVQLNFDSKKQNKKKTVAVKVPHF